MELRQRPQGVIFMKIGIDIRYLSIFDNKAGLYQYIYNLVAALLSIDSYNDYILLSTLRGFTGDGKIPRRFLRRFSGRLSDLLLEKLAFPIELLMGKVDIFHGPCFFVPNSLRCKSIVTIHDLMPLRAPEFLTPYLLALFKKKIYSHRGADVVIAVSNFTKQEIIELLNVSETRIRVIYNGISPAFCPVQNMAELERIKIKYGIEGPYLLFVGNIEPKKNIETLLHACSKLRNATIYKYPLVIVGSKSFGFKGVSEAVKQFHAEKETIFTDIVDTDDLPYLYGGAELFIFPSLFEGFGIPVIEAMACGIPVVASNRTSIPEITGDAAILIDPLNVDEMAGAMYNVLSTPLLKRQLVEKGIERAKKFSWEKTARETLKLYKELG